MTEKQIVAISASSLTTWQACPTAFHYSSELRLSPFESDEKMDKGSLGHAMLAHYYQLVKDGKAGDYGATLDEVLEIGRIEAVKFELSPDAIEQTLISVRGYLESYFGESWTPVLIEQPFSQELFNSDSLQILFEGRLDLGIEVGGRFVPVDHKFKSAFRPINPMDNQFIGTSWAFNSDEFIVNQVGIQKKEQKFRRDPLSYPKEVIEEWKEATIASVVEMISYEAQGKYPRRYSKCWNCKFSDLCYTHPEARDQKIKINFVKKQFDLYSSEEG